MEYTIRELSKLAGISTRTLRYYDEIGLLHPVGRLSSGSRIYREAEVDTLQQILFYREMGLELEKIRTILSDPDFDRMKALKDHQKKLELRMQKMELLLENVKQTIRKEERKMTMTDQDKFKGFKEELVRKNEETYGTEIREKYGENVVEESYKKMLHLTEEEYSEMLRLEEDLNKVLSKAVKEQASPLEDLGKQAAELHKKWLSYTWPVYTREAHIGLVTMYVLDKRFTEYYDKNGEGCTEFLKKAVETFA